MSDFTDRPASHAAAHAEGRACPCDGQDPPGWHVTGWDLVLVLAAVVAAAVFA